MYTFSDHKLSSILRSSSKTYCIVNSVPYHTIGCLQSGRPINIFVLVSVLPIPPGSVRIKELLSRKIFRLLQFVAVYARCIASCTAPCCWCQAGGPCRCPSCCTITTQRTDSETLDSTWWIWLTFLKEGLH